MHEGYYIVHFRTDGKSNIGLEGFEGCLRALTDSRNKLKKSYSSSAMEIINSRGWKNLKEVAQDLNIEIRDIRIPEERVLEQMGEGALDPDEIEEIRKRNISVK